MNMTPRLKTAIQCLIDRRHTSRELMIKLPANNPPDYFKMIRHDFGLTVLKRKVANASHFEFWIPECDKPKALRLLASAPTLTSDNTNQPPKPINKNTEVKNDKHNQP